MNNKKQRIEDDAKAIAAIVCKTDTDYRGNLLRAIGAELEKQTQAYTAKMFATMSRIYGTHEYM